MPLLEGGIASLSFSLRILENEKRTGANLISTINIDCQFLSFFLFCNLSARFSSPIKARVQSARSLLSLSLACRLIFITFRRRRRKYEDESIAGRPPHRASLRHLRPSHALRASPRLRRSEPAMDVRRWIVSPVIGPSECLSSGVRFHLSNDPAEASHRGPPL